MQNNSSKSIDLTLLAIACLTIMVGCVLIPGLPNIAKQLGVADYSSWLITVPSLGVLVFGFYVSRLIDQLGLYKALCLGLFSYGLLGIAGMFLSGVVPVFLDRLLLGGATALIMSAGTGLISVFHEGKSRLKMIAKQGMAIELGGVIFLSVAGVLATVGWQYPFFIYLVAWLLLLLVVVFIPHDKRLITEDTTAVLNIPFSLKMVYFAAVFSMVVFFTGIIILPHSLQVLEWNEAKIGYFLSFISLVAVLASFLMPRVIQRLGENNTLFLGFMCYAIAHVFFAIATHGLLYGLGGISLGFGFGFTIPLVNHMTIEQSHASQRGRNLAYLAMAIFAGQFFSSFMAFLPRNQFIIFSITAVIAVLVGLIIRVFHKKSSLTL